MYDSVRKILDYLDELEESREEMLDISHKAIRKSSAAMASLHRGANEEVSEKIKDIEADIKKLNKILDSKPQFTDHGALIAAHREYAEVILTKTLIKGEEIPDAGAINVLYKSYAQALAEAVGELRRHFLNLLRKDKVKESNKLHEKMERIFDQLQQFDYPDSILPGMKHRKDVARKILEKTRADITRAVREKSLEEALKNTEKKIGSQNEI